MTAMPTPSVPLAPSTVCATPHAARAIPSRRWPAGRPRVHGARCHARWLLAALLSLLATVAAAQPRAWLDRDRIAYGETVTLNIETTAAGAPDYAPLQREFAVSGNSSRRQFEMVNGVARSRTLYAVALNPRRDGRLIVPSLRVGNERTAPLPLLVTAASAAPPARAGDEVFIESEADDQDPYVQQAVGWVVRLYSAVPLVSGQLDQAAPDGASLQRVGDDAQYSRSIGGRSYTVVERRYLLVPERSGVLTIPGAQFEGRGTGGFFDDLFGSMSSGSRGGALQTRAAPRILQVRPAPANAPQPWLPLHALQLRYRAAPQALRAGAAATLTVEAVADGATAAQMPELQLPTIDGVQVFPEPVQADESFVEGRPRVTLRRTFSLVPSRDGRVTLPGLQWRWWDVRSGTARTASLPAQTWQVAPGDGASSASPAVPAAAASGATASDKPLAATTGGANRGWVLAALLFAALWLFTLVWALQHRSRPQASGAAGAASATGQGGAIAPGATLADLKRVLASGDFAEVAATLCAMARPAAADVDELQQRLADPRQQAAVAAMQRARWGDGDGPAARAALREAFARGPHWQSDQHAAAAPPPLPPLYPSR